MKIRYMEGVMLVTYMMLLSASIRAQLNARSMEFTNTEKLSNVSCDFCLMAFIDKQQLAKFKNLEQQPRCNPLAAEAELKEFKSTNTIFSWRIVNFSQLRQHILYFRLFENADVKCVLKLFKTRKALYVCLRSEQIRWKSARFYIDDETDHASIISYAKELINGLYVGDFRNEVFFPSYLKDDVLTVSFRYNDVSQKIVRHIPVQEPDCLMDLNEFCNDMKYMYLASLHSDFLIHVGEYTFNVHKFVLASRSKFFEDFFMKNEAAEDYSLEAAPRIVHMMLVYLYSGEIKKLEMASMIEMYDVAKQLRIDELSEKCLHFISESINDENYPIIEGLAKTLNSAELLRIANQYGRKMKKGKRKRSRKAN